MSQKTLIDYFGITKKETKPQQTSFLDEIPLEQRLVIGKNKIIFLPVLIKALHKKCRTHGGCTPKIIDDFYAIFQENQILFLISFFKRDIPQNEEYYKRLGEEFQLIKENNFIKVFLQCIEILSLVGDIQFIIRGSAGSSLVTYLLGITNIDPIRENISLARFMSYTRKDMPDIDIDLPHNKREIIYHRIFQRWEGKVARISNHVIFRKKTSIKEAIRQAGYRKFIPKDFKIEDIFEKEEDQNLVFEAASKLEGTFAHHSLHCGGIVIFDDIVPEKYYLKEFHIFKGACGVKSDKITGPQINLNKDEVEDENLIKLDILSNRGLSQLADISPMLIEDYPDNDLLVRELFARGENLGLTFGESRGMYKIFRIMKPQSIYDIAVALALIRPCASGGGQKSEFLRDYSILLRDKRTFTRENDIDFLIFDDDAIHYIARILDIDEAQADVYRKAFAKNRYDKKNQFLYELKEKHPEFDDDKIDLIYTLLEQLQEYSFCKSHAYSYAKLVWALAYQKTRNPQQFWLAALNNCNSSYRKWVHFREAKKSGIELTLGKRPWTLRGNKLMCSNMQLKLIDDPVRDYFQFGYWISDEFLPNCYAEYYTGIPEMPKPRKRKDGTTFIPEPILEPVEMVRFRGIVACGRPYQANKKMKQIKPKEMAGGESLPQEGFKQGRIITFFTIGVADGQYLDLVLWGKYPIGKIHCIMGEGMVKDHSCPWVQVTRFRFDRIYNILLKNFTSLLIFLLSIFVVILLSVIIDSISCLLFVILYFFFK